MRATAPAIPRPEEDDADVAAAPLAGDGRGEPLSHPDVDEGAPGTGELQPDPSPDHALVAGAEVAEAPDPSRLEAGVDAHRAAQGEGVGGRRGEPAVEVDARSVEAPDARRSKVPQLEAGEAVEALAVVARHRQADLAQRPDVERLEQIEPAAGEVAVARIERLAGRDGGARAPEAPATPPAAPRRLGPGSDDVPGAVDLQPQQERLLEGRDREGEVGARLLVPAEEVHVGGARLDGPFGEVTHRQGERGAGRFGEDVDVLGGVGPRLARVLVAALEAAQVRLDREGEGPSIPPGMRQTGIGPGGDEERPGPGDVDLVAGSVEVEVEEVDAGERRPGAPADS